MIGETIIDTTTVVKGLDTPWEILWGPDNHIWFTERNGQVSRLDPSNGQLKELLDIPDAYESGESGLLGMVLHPDFPQEPYIFLVYNYYEDSRIKEKLVRYTYSESTLHSPIVLLQNLAGNRNHDGSRIVIDNNNMLYFSTGDAGNTSLSQNLNSYSGKILRLHLDGSIPADNPLSDSPIWSWGHRNPQGLVIAPSGIMYSSEHGPSSDDEVNIIEKGRNYGWPNVYGYCDEPSEEQFCADSNVVEPLLAWTPTLAVAGLDFYDSDAIPEWSGNLLLTTLKAKRLVSMKLNQDGRSIDSENQHFLNWWGRLRDLCIAPDGRVFLAVSNLDGRGNPVPGDDRIIEIKARQNHLNVNQTVQLCAGDSLLAQGGYQTEPGTYYDTIRTNPLMDTIRITTLEIEPASESTMMITLCNDEFVLFGGDTIRESGTYSDTLVNANGCDSILYLQVIMNQPAIWNDTLYICQGDSIIINGSYQYLEGQYSDTLMSLAGCDSLSVVQLLFFEENKVDLISDTTIQYNTTLSLIVDESMYDVIAWNANSDLNENSLVFNPGDLEEGYHTITVSVTDTNGCIIYDTARVTVTGTSNFPESRFPDLLIYPNPVNGPWLWISNPSLQDVDVKIYNATGKLLTEQNILPGENKISFPYGQGFYILVVAHEGKQYPYRISAIQ